MRSAPKTTRQAARTQRHTIAKYIATYIYSSADSEDSQSKISGLEDADLEDADVEDEYQDEDSNRTDSYSSDDASGTKSPELEESEPILGPSELPALETEATLQSELKRPLATSFHPTEEAISTRIIDAPFTLLSPTFTGRDEQLKHLEDLLTHRKIRHGATCAITGRIEVGKTQLALKYASRVSSRSTSVNLFWLSAASTDTLSRGLENLLVLIGGNEKVVSFNHEHRLQAARQALETFAQGGKP